MGILFLIGWAVAAIGGLWLVVVAFKESVLWGLGVLVVPFVGLFFAVTHWKEAKSPFLLSTAGAVVAVATAFLMGPPPEGLDELSRLVGTAVGWA